MGTHHQDKRSILSAKINALGVVFTLLTCLSTAGAMLCPIECQCSIHGVKILADCSGLGLRHLPELDPAMEIDWMDLSNNQLTEFPTELSQFQSLESLDLSANQISRIPANALDQFLSLRTLTLNENNITNWKDINPNEFLLNTMITTLQLAGNPLTSFSSTDLNLLLISPTLRILDISHCRISKVNGVDVLQGLTKLEFLDLSHNPLRFVSNMVSPSLIKLDLSNCQLTGLPGDFLADLPALISLNLSRNHRLSLHRSPDEFVSSATLTKIDLSFCNMENVELAGFPALTSALLQGNLIKDLSRDSFINNGLLQRLQLSSNTIGLMHPDTFAHLQQLREVDLSYNVITRVEREMFRANDKLSTINLSRNYIGRLSRIVSPSLVKLNMSSCEIVSVDSDALVGLPNLVELDLSQNLIANLPDGMSSENLQLLDLRMCRLSSIRNSTFQHFPELARLRLSGNRFTNPFRREFFDHNPYLNEIWLGDNPWRCECRNEDFLQFFRFITEQPSKIFDRSHLRCGSPEELYGSLWDMACFNYWVQTPRPLGTAEKVWTIVLVGLLLFAGGMCLIMTVRRCIEGRELTRREAERQIMMEEHRDVMRQNRMAMDQQAQLNAPDPRETRPPCYEDALLLPRLDGSFASLNELGQKKEFKLGVHIPKDTENSSSSAGNQEDPPLSPRNRCRSEEVLSMRDVVANRRSGRYRTPTEEEPKFENHHYANVSRSARRSNSRSRLPTSPPPTRIPTPPPDLPPPPPIPSKPTGAFKSNLDLHYHSTEILNMHHGSKALPAVVPLSPVLSQGSGSISAEYDDLQDFNQSRESPYSRRKSKKLSSFNPLPQPDEILILEDHYPRMATPQAPRKTGKEEASSSGSSFSHAEDDDDSFVAVSSSDLNRAGEQRQNELYATPEQTSVVVQVHRQPRESSL